MNSSIRPTRMRARLVLAIVYLVLAVAGAIGTWAFNVAFILDPGDFGASGYVAAWFANAASSSAAVDILVVATASGIFMLVEGARLGWARWVWVLIPLSLLVAAAFTVPLFLSLREFALRRRALAAGGASGGAAAAPAPVPA